MICYHATQIVEIFQILPLFLIYYNLHWGWFPRDSHYLSFYIRFHSIASSNSNYSHTPCSTISFLATSTRSPAYFIVRINWFYILKSPNSSIAPLVRYSLYKMSIIDKQHPYLTPLPIFTLLISSWSNRTLTLWSMYNSLTKLLSHQLIPVSFMVCNNLIHFSRWNACCLSYEASMQFLISVLSFFSPDVVLSTPRTFLVSFFV
jgi:hypothetical protein